METALCLIEANEPIYPIELLRSMRDQRAQLIQTSGQFVFVANAIHKVYQQGIVRPLKEFQNKYRSLNGESSSSVLNGSQTTPVVSSSSSTTVLPGN
jgi:hypothetical protein